jgi:hypothetical protein
MRLSYGPFQLEFDTGKIVVGSQGREIVVFDFVSPERPPNAYVSLEEEGWPIR